MASVNFPNVNIYQTSGVRFKNSEEKSVQKSSPSADTNPAFRAEAYTSAVTVRTSLNTKDEKKKYEALYIGKRLFACGLYNGGGEARAKDRP